MKKNLNTWNYIINTEPHCRTMDYRISHLDFRISTEIAQTQRAERRFSIELSQFNRD